MLFCHGLLVVRNPTLRGETPVNSQRVENKGAPLFCAAQTMAQEDLHQHA